MYSEAWLKAWISGQGFTVEQAPTQGEGAEGGSAGSAAGSVSLVPPPCPSGGKTPEQEERAFWAALGRKVRDEVEIPGRDVYVNI